jgi:hypothetical protein
MRKPLTMEDYLNSRYIVEPFHLYDCCLVSNGGIAVILTSAERARSLKQPPVYVLGMGQAAPGDNQRTDREPGIYTGAKQSGEKALRMAGIDLLGHRHLRTLRLLHLHRFGDARGLRFLPERGRRSVRRRWQAGPERIGAHQYRRGELSAYYMWGFTPLSEAVVQARGQGGDRQVEKNDLILACGNGGVLNYHSTTIVSKHPA